AQDRLEDARSLLTSALSKKPQNLRYRLALARLTQRQGKSPSALQILDEAERELGPSVDLQLARVDYWGMERGERAGAELANLAETRKQIPVTDRPAFLERLGSAEIRLGELNLARQHWNEWATLAPENIPVRLALFDLAMAAGDQEI